MTGVYQIQSKIKPEKTYIGSAININNRWHTHISMLKNNNHRSKKLQNHFNKYGLEDMIFTIIEDFIFISKEHLLSREQFYLDTLNPTFNFAKIAGSPMLGLKFSEEHCNNLSKSLKGKSSWIKGKHHSEESKKKMRKKKLKPFSDEHRKNLSKSHEGKHPSKTTRDIMSKSHTGNKSNSGRNLSEEHKNNIRKGQPDKSGINNPRFNVPVLNSTRLKMSEKQRERWKLRKESNFNISTIYPKPV
jgi:group I intron endonuclease